ncbi:isocitrate lyase/PEP mutase family protein [Paraburkholderia caledonica]|uniref:isocitrate lyase/PEP mutase family protein n=1 Tax=Paraburkholderia caledonica TaxID=134536 RepID=UPI000361DE4D|nr:oxaloacetate decarboxylase [Paraburkholderia caledonica]
MSHECGAFLRRTLQPSAALLLPGVSNALAARIAEEAGYAAVFVTGAGIANSYLGAPDIGLTTVTEVGAHINAIREAVSIPIIADADTGFGNALNVMRTVRLFERAGANCIMLEDQTFPKRCGHFEGKAVVSIEEMTAKIKAAVDARANADTLIMARTDSRAIEGFERSLERIRTYRDAGADVLFVEAPSSLEELARIPREAPGVQVCNMVIGGKTPLLPQAQLSELGYAGVIYANAALQAAMFAMKNVLEHLRSHGSIEGREDQIMSFAERQKMVNFARYDALAKQCAND